MKSQLDVASGKYSSEQTGILIHASAFRSEELEQLRMHAFCIIAIAIA